MEKESDGLVNNSGYFSVFYTNIFTIRITPGVASGPWPAMGIIENKNLCLFWLVAGTELWVSGWMWKYKDGYVVYVMWSAVCSVNHRDLSRSLIVWQGVDCGRL